MARDEQMLYALHQLQRSLLAPIADAAGAMAAALHDAEVWPATLLRANFALVHRLARTYPRPAFGITTVVAHGHAVDVVEETIVDHPFCRLVRFARRSEDPTVTAAIAADPRVLVCAPLSGHYPTLLRDTVSTLLHDHDVYLTEWVNAREVPVAAGPFQLADYVTEIQRFIRVLGARELHVVAVCQPTVPVVAAVALMATAGEVTPRTLALLGGPVDARRSPTAVNRLATEHPIAWFEDHMIHRVPVPHPGHGRAVYPGFVQHAAFVMMNPTRHAAAYRGYWLDQLRGASTTGAAAAIHGHEQFYDEYNAVLDMDAAYYLDTVRVVFQEFALARGVWDVGGVRVDPAAIKTTALLTVEGAHDDISGAGQTEAAHALCSGIASDRKHHLVADGCGHYGLFAGHRWREAIYPALRAFIRTHEAA